MRLEFEEKAERMKAVHNELGSPRLYHMKLAMLMSIFEKYVCRLFPI